mgnify:CR=1 FL=1
MAENFPSSHKEILERQLSGGRTVGEVAQLLSAEGVYDEPDERRVRHIKVKLGLKGREAGLFPNELVSTTNEKTGLASIDLPPLATCPGATSFCKERCYDIDLGRRRPQHFLREYQTYLEVKKRLGNPKELADWLAKLVEQGIKEEEKLGIPRDKAIIRLHVGGDVFHKNYAEALKEVARRFPEVHFYLYTHYDKAVEWLRDRPRNLRVNLSLDPANAKEFLSRPELLDAVDELTYILPDEAHLDEARRIVEEAKKRGKEAVIFLEKSRRASLQKLVREKARDLLPYVCPEELGAETTCSVCRRCAVQPERRWRATAEDPYVKLLKEERSKKKSEAAAAPIVQMAPIIAAPEEEGGERKVRIKIKI